jgi:hypothetical protein
MANVRADLRDYVGDAGFLYDTQAEARRIVTGPFPEDMRQRGFELARRSDIAGHKGRLTDLWQRAVASAPRR